MTDKEIKYPRGVFKKRYGNAKDPVIPFLRNQDDNRKDEYYKKHFTELLTLIFNRISKNMNYAHFNFFIPRNLNLPLSYENQHMDICYLTSDKCLVFLQVHVLSPERVKKRYYTALRQPDYGDNQEEG